MCKALVKRELFGKDEVKSKRDSIQAIDFDSYNAKRCSLASDQIGWFLVALRWC